MNKFDHLLYSCLYSIGYFISIGFYFNFFISLFNNFEDNTMRNYITLIVVSVIYFGILGWVLKKSQSKVMNIISVILSVMTIPLFLFSAIGAKTLDVQKYFELISPSKNVSFELVQYNSNLLFITTSIVLILFVAFVVYSFKKTEVLWGIKKKPKLEEIEE